MTTIKIKFLQDGRWGDHPSQPLFEVKAGDERDVSPLLANFAVDSGKAEFVREKRKPGPKVKPETGPIPKAESDLTNKKKKGKTKDTEPEHQAQPD